MDECFQFINANSLIEYKTISYTENIKLYVQLSGYILIESVDSETKSKQMKLLLSIPLIAIVVQMKMENPAIS